MEELFMDVKRLILVLLVICFTLSSCKKPDTDIQTLNTDDQVDTHVSYERQLVRRDELPIIEVDGKDVEFPREIMDLDWEWASLTYPLLIVHDRSNRIFDLEEKKFIDIVSEYRDFLERDWDRITKGEKIMIMDIEILPEEFDILTAATYSPKKDKIAIAIEGPYMVLTNHTVVGYYDIKSRELFFTNINIGDISKGPAWSPNDQYYAYSFGDAADYSRFLYIDSINNKDNVLKIDGENLLRIMEPNSEGRFDFPFFRDIIWSDDGSILKFTTNINDEDYESDFFWEYNIKTRDLEFLK